MTRTSNGYNVIKILILLSMAKQVTLTNFFKKPCIEINNYLEDQSVDRNGTTAGSEFLKYVSI